MIDWHSHILPNLDDGSHDVAESISLMQMQAAQGVSATIAAPHFFANDETVEAFLARRQQSFECLQAELPANLPQIFLGAEVKYYQGISRLADLRALRIEGTKLLLLEMPMTSWTEYMIRELVEIASKSSTRLILAHIERYLALQKQMVWDRLLESGILMQSNASFFCGFTTKRKALNLLNDGRIHLLGSDCHNMKLRPPRIGKAFETIQKKLGVEYLLDMNEYGYSLLATNNNA